MPRDQRYDHTRLDRLAVGHAAALARTHGSSLYLLHVEEGVTSQVYGSLASTAEVEAGQEYLDRIAQPTIRRQRVVVVALTRLMNDVNSRRFPA